MQTRKRIDPERLKILAAKLNLWLLDLLLWLSEWMGRALPRAVRMMLREDIREALSGARMLVCIMAVARWTKTLPPNQNRTMHPRSAPPGFRRAAPVNDVRGLRRAVYLRGRTIAARLAEVRAILDNLDAWAERVCARLDATPPGVRFVLCFMLAERLRALMTPAPAFVDSS